jgi:hypothetical protein
VCIPTGVLCNAAEDIWAELLQWDNLKITTLPHRQHSGTKEERYREIETENKGSHLKKTHPKEEKRIPHYHNS